MFKIMLQGKRSFIVGEKDVLKGGKEKVYNVSGQVSRQFELEPGQFIYEVTDECGQFLETYNDVFVIEKPEHLKAPEKVAAVTPESTNELLVQMAQQMANLQKQVLALTDQKKAPAKKKKPAPKKKETLKP